jgi:hypothetical protein
MLKRRDVLEQLKSAGVSMLSPLKRHCREFEHYMLFKYGYRIVKGKTSPDEGLKDSFPTMINHNLAGSPNCYGLGKK